MMDNSLLILDDDAPLRNRLRRAMEARDFEVVDAGLNHNCGVTTDGEVTCWGSDEYGQSTPPAGIALVKISAGYDHSCGITAEGSAHCWGIKSFIHYIKP